MSGGPRSRVATALALLVASAPGAAAAAELPLGSRTLDERRERATVAPGGTGRHGGIGRTGWITRR